MASTQRESNTTTNSTFNLFRTGNNIDKAAGQFTAGASYDLDHLDVYLARNGTTDLGTFIAQIFTDNAGEPGVQVGGDSDTVDFLTGVSLTAGVVAISWSTNLPPIVSGTKYWIVLSPSWVTESGNYIKQTCTDAEGTTVLSFWDKDTSVWTVQPGTIYFVNYGDPATAGGRISRMHNLNGFAGQGQQTFNPMN